MRAQPRRALHTSFAVSVLYYTLRLLRNGGLSLRRRPHGGSEMARKDKVQKTNAMRELERGGVAYTALTFEEP